VQTLVSVWPVVVGAVTRDEETFVTELRHLPEGWPAVAGLVLLGVLLWAVVWMYRREGRIGASAGVRMFLATLRCAVFLILAVVFLEPVRVRILRRWIDSYTLVLVDDSSSMDLTDRYRDESSAARVQAVLGGERPQAVRRRDLVERILNRDDHKFFRDLASSNRVKLYTFSDDAKLQASIRANREASTTSSEPSGGASSHAERSEASPSREQTLRFAQSDNIPAEFPATGPATNLDRALRRAVESLGSAPIAGVVVLTDGGINQGATAEEIARFANDRRLAVHTIGVGDPATPRNIRVTEVLAPQNAFQQDPFAVTATLTSQGIEGETIRVQLRERNATDGSEGRIVDSRTLVVGGGGAIGTVTFDRRQQRVGRFVYTVEAPPVEDESVTEDNSKQTTVNVIDTRTRVLLIAGAPSWDYRYVTTLLQRDDTIDVSCWLQSADLSAVRDGDIVIDHLPTAAEELFQYDVVILMDPDKAEFDEPWCRLVDKLVTEHGGGLLLAAARAHTPAFVRERALKPLLDLLPVTLDPEADLLLNQIGHYQLSPSPFEIPQATYAHPVLRLADDPVSTKLAWQGIGDVYWHYPVLREKPVATVLMRHGHPRMKNAFGGHVLAAVQFVGAGRTGFLGFDSTWRWRRFGPELYDRFWVQFVRYLSEGKLLGGSKRATLLVENEHPALGEAVTVTARLLDSRFEPLQRDEVAAQVSVEDQRVDFPLAARRDRPGWFEGRFVPDRVGSYRIRLALPGAAPGGPPPLEVGESAEVEREILVSRPNLEILHPQMNRAALTTIAEQSQGGRYWEIDEADGLPAVIPDLHEEIPVRSRPTTLWDNWKVLTLLVSLLSVEWAVRKWTRLL